MDTDTTYKLFKPLNREFTFDVDVSNLPCGLNGAVYFSSMDADGGMSKYSTNKAGAKVRGTAPSKFIQSAEIALRTVVK